MDAPTMMGRGILSREVAGRIGLKVNRTDSMPIQNPRHISVLDSDADGYSREELLQVSHDVLGDVSFYIRVPEGFERFIGPITHYGIEAPGERESRKRIKPERIFTVRIFGTERQRAEELIRVAKEKNIPVYGEDGRRIWPLLKE